MTDKASPTNLIWSNLTAQSSEQIALAAAPLVVVVMLGGGAAETGFVQLIQTLPFLLLSLPIGVLVDRCSRKGLMIAAEMLRAATAGAIILALLLNALSVPLLAALGFVGAIGTLAFSIGGPALLPALVGPDQLSRMNRWLELARSTAFVAGPPLAGALVAWTGAAPAFAVAMAASTLSVFLLLPLREPPQPPPVRRHAGHDLVEGFRFVMGHQLLLPIAATAMMFNIGWFMLQTVFVVFLVKTLGADPGTVGLLFGFYGIGMIAGALAAPRLARLFSLGTLVAIGPLGGLVGSLLVLAAWATASQLCIGIALFCFGFGPILWSINTTSLRQVVTPARMQGRVTALLTLATAGARPIGAGLGILVAGVFGVGGCLLAATLCFGIQLLIILLSAAVRLSALPQPGPGAAPV